MDLKASPLCARLDDLLPISIHLGEAELLFTDSIRYADLARAAVVAIALSIWEDMRHAFLSFVCLFAAAVMWLAPSLTS
ncbi:hypothetical protein P775_01380 [Puniceibacterium antarcticum]|uniref:Uncharacterized protein n=1 Tax=Puniceibacterium antarcticum TaxID=1206336 RepID=A0A2G8RK50_9RHOB|nr:alpha/beta hydrolase fold domain-containing protein [Puniceibacterium antarcticum]PIL21976.1 hypothetical protein P775_01380 [Puniceibacterium antarcticum]